MSPPKESVPSGTTFSETGPASANEDERHQHKRSQSGTFDKLVAVNLELVSSIEKGIEQNHLLVSAIRDGIQQAQLVKKAHQALRVWVVLAAVCCLLTLAVSVATLITVRNNRDENKALLAAFTEACASGTKVRR